ncbi:RNA polymerase factor sigma-54 [Paenibacillus planticolens]|uniref:RNA polymerase factor sigma-54 n=1 Tax=Paenibacillus planticolens TaxID=2654976 RepID=A0ABX1ZXP1_9BACL|nr:RNA polymerase factor sigma-54 [Paenibacillus planticolens]NOV04812.1 RNA polymerase factor sigma-54 [Paenibacillus planticolens]
MEIGLSVNQRNQLAITASMRQSMEILQLSSIDLQEHLHTLANDNPIMDILPPSKTVSAISRSSHKAYGSAVPGDWWLNLNMSSSPNLENIVTEQLNLSSLESRVCSFIVGCLDDNGYLTQTTEWIANYLNTELSLVKKIVTMIQGIDPAGLAASSLEECLLLQLPPADRKDSLISHLIQFELQPIANGKIKSLAKKYAVEPSAIQGAIDRIKDLNPKPGAMFGHDKPQYVIPDLFLRNHNGSFEIYLENDFLPRVRLNPHYSDLLLEKQQPKDVKHFLRKKRQEARWIMQCLDYRKSTLLKIAAAIFDKQTEFCKYGPSHIQPISMRIIAEELNIHDSTVSRAVNHKYIMTPWGFYELKHFFSSALKQTDGESVSALTAKERIKEIICSDDKRAPISDLKISEILQQEGIIISRRTITKYREQMNILSTAQRKRYEA